MQLSARNITSPGIPRATDATLRAVGALKSDCCIVIALSRASDGITDITWTQVKYDKWSVLCRMSRKRKEEEMALASKLKGGPSSRILLSILNSFFCWSMQEGLLLTGIRNKLHWRVRWWGISYPRISLLWRIWWRRQTVVGKTRRFVCNNTTTSSSLRIRLSTI